MSKGPKQLSPDAKWYSNGLTRDKASKLEIDYAKIERPDYLVNRGTFALTFTLKSTVGTETNWQLPSDSDIKELLKRTGAYSVRRLEGKVIETYSNSYMIEAISVNPNLV